jgi:four helix bundle protein
MGKNMKTQNLIAEKSYLFALRIIKLSQYLTRQNEFVISKQVLRSGTSIAANIEEALGGCSKKDFTAKLSISYKEARETRLWIRLLKDSEMVSESASASILRDCEELLRILTRILKTCKNQS